MFRFITINKEVFWSGFLKAIHEGSGAILLKKRYS